jgi:2-polyprenyl-3-methyl-5-hydroxy-6-metoxy-1,4-benzoquinol methylase
MLISEDEYRSIGATYDPGHFLEIRDEQILRRHLSVDIHRSELMRAARLLDNNTPKKHRLRLLDIGCGMGGYLVAGRDLGFDVTGVEPSESHSRIGRDVFNLQIQTGYFDAVKFGDEKFDIVVLSHVIEHIFSPAEFLAGVSTLLSPKGIILVFTPNARSTLATISGSAWSMLAPEDHVTMMTPQALRSITPPGFSVKIRTNELLWEPAVVLLQSLRHWLFRAQPSPATITPSGHTQSKNTIAMINANWFIRAILSMVSSPPWFYDIIFGKAHCCVAVYKKAL